MFKVSDSELSALVAELVPDHYQPGAPEQVVRGIRLLSQSDIHTLACCLLKTEFQQSSVFGLCLDLQEIKGNQSEQPRFQIYLANEFPDRDTMTFILLHEIGHVDWHMNADRRSRFDPKEFELYADLYAFEVLSSVRGLDYAIDSLTANASNQGFAQEIMRYATD